MNIPRADEAPVAADYEWVNVKCCPVCGSTNDNHSRFSRINDEGFSLRYLMCAICGLVFQSPRLSPHSREVYYAQAYHLQKMPEAEDVSRNRWVQKQRGEYLTNWAQEWGGSIKRHVDIGASRGLVMEAFREQFSCDSYGIEPGRDLRQQLQERDLPVFADAADLPVSLRGKVDLITLSHTLEHLAEPREYLIELQHRWLSPDGLILLEVPNLTWHPALEFSHLTAFTSESLQALAGHAGYMLANLSAHGRPYSRRLPLFLLAAFRQTHQADAKFISAPTKAGVQLRRWVGTRLFQLAQSINSMRYHRSRMNPWRS